MCRATNLCCFRCMSWFDKTNVKSCADCGDWKCTNCGACLCALSKEEKKIALAYMATYENLLKEVTGESYDFSRHQEVLEELGINRMRLVKATVEK
jgi:hypothetical protein